MTDTQFDYEIEQAAAALKAAAAKLAELKAYEDCKILYDYREGEEVVTRGMRDRSPTTRTNSARTSPTSGARDALPSGCISGLLLYPAQKEQARSCNGVVARIAEITANHRCSRPKQETTPRAASAAS